MSKRREKPVRVNGTEENREASVEEVKQAGGGRPKGSQSQERPVVTFRPPSCPSCKSTRRKPFSDGPVVDDRIAVEIDGQIYNREVWHNTRCLDCQQSYRIIEYRFEPQTEDAKEN